MKRWGEACFGLGLGASAAPAQQVTVRPAQPLAVQRSEPKSELAPDGASARSVCRSRRHALRTQHEAIDGALLAVR